MEAIKERNGREKERMVDKIRREGVVEAKGWRQ